MKKLILLTPVVLLIGLLLMGQSFFKRGFNFNNPPDMLTILPADDPSTDFNSKPVNYVWSHSPVIHPLKGGDAIVSPNFRPYPTTNTNQSEVIIVRHPLNQNMMWASANMTTIGGSLFISEGLYLTTNSGVNWFGSDTIASQPINNHSGDPGPIIDKDGTLLMSHLIGSGPGMGVSRSTNLGQSWDNIRTINTSSSNDKNLACTDGSPSSPFYGNSYVYWTDFAQSGIAPIVLSRSTNGGQNWSAPVNISNPTSPYPRSQGCDGVVGNDGTVYVTWRDHQSLSPFTGKRVGLARSTDGGASWNTTTEAFLMNGTRSTSFGSYGIRTNDFPRIDIDRTGGPRDGWLYIVTSQYNLAPAGSDADIILNRSTDGGDTWSSGIRVNQDPLNNGKVQFFPAIRVDEQGGINVVYYDNRNTATDSAEVFVSRSIDGGDTWEDIVVSDHRFRPRPISGLAGGYMGDYIGITSGNSKVWPVWMDNSTGNFQLWTASITIANNPLNSFNIQTPSPGVTLTSFPGSTTTVSITWDTSATGASYKWIFGSPTPTPRLISLPSSSNSLTLTLGQLDGILEGLGLNPGQSITGQWDVWAFRPNPPQNDSLKSSNGPRSITLERGIPQLSAFNLNSPPNNTTITTSVFNNSQVNFNWTKSGDGTTYRWKFGSPNISTVLLNVDAEFDSSYSFVNSGLDVILSGIGLDPGDSIVGQWAVWAYNGLDSIKSTQTYNITFKRQDKGDFLVMYDSTSSSGRTSRDSVINVLNQLNKTYDLFNRGGQTSTDAMTMRGYKGVILLGQGTSVLSTKQKDSVIAYLNSGGTTVATKSKLIIFSEDVGYQFGRNGSTYQDLNFINNYLGWDYVADRPGISQQGLIGSYINSGLADSTIGSWPEVIKKHNQPGTSQHVLYLYRRHINNPDSAHAIGMYEEKWNVATFGTDVRSIRNANGGASGGPVHRILKAAIDYVNEEASGLEPVTGTTIPERFELSQNYPNPFNPTTKINFAIAKQGLVTLKIFDITGREVATLVNQTMAPGYYSIDFNASVLSSGVYFYRLHSADFIDVKRMVLLK